MWRGQQVAAVIAAAAAGFQDRLQAIHEIGALVGHPDRAAAANARIDAAVERVVQHRGQACAYLGLVAVADRKVPQHDVPCAAREPDSERLRQAIDFVARQSTNSGLEAALTDLTHVLFNSSEFLYVP